MNKTISVIGGGSWGTALVKVLAENISDQKILWWVRKEETAVHIRNYKHNPNYLSSVEIHPDQVLVSTDLQKVVDESDVLVLAIPSAFLKSTIDSIDIKSLANKKIVSAIKGLVPETCQIVGEFARDYLNIPATNIAVIAGPSHAEEISLEKLSYLTIASEGEDFASEIAEMISCRYVRTSTSDDIYGTEYAAVLKNIYAVASGIAHGIGYGDNFQAVLLSNAITEIKRFIATVHPIDRDTDGSAYLGDLLVTCYSQFSRNRTFGSMLGKGYSVKSAQMEMNMIAEGFYATKSIYDLNKKYHVEMPLHNFVYDVIYRQIKPRDAIKVLIPQLS